MMILLSGPKILSENYFLFDVLANKLSTKSACHMLHVYPP
jgi:hypothetical protein